MASPAPAAAVAACYQGPCFVRLVEPAAIQGAPKRVGRYALAPEELLRD